MLSISGPARSTKATPASRAGRRCSGRIRLAGVGRFLRSVATTPSRSGMIAPSTLNRHGLYSRGRGLGTRRISRRRGCSSASYEESAAWCANCRSPPSPETSRTGRPLRAQMPTRTCRVLVSGVLSAGPLSILEQRRRHGRRNRHSQGSPDQNASASSFASACCPFWIPSSARPTGGPQMDQAYSVALVL